MTGRHSKSGAVVLAEMFEAYGVTHFFHVPAVLRRTMAEIEFAGRPIERVVTHGEKSAVYMADGYARVSGKPGVCGAQVVGALNLAAGLREPWLANSPVIAFTGGRDPATKFRSVYQEVDDVPAFEPVTKFNATVDDVRRIPDMVRHAFRVATTGSPGPVHLQFKGNEAQLDQDEADIEALSEPLFASVPPFRPEPSEVSVRSAVAELEAADRPVIVAGGGVRLSGAAAELVALAERLGIPVATSLNAKDTIPARHPLSIGVVGSYSRASANRIVGRADLVCYIGSSTGGMTTHFWAVPPVGTPTIQVDIDPESIGRHYPLKAAVHGDAKVTLSRMFDIADGSTAERRRSWLDEVRELSRAWYQESGPNMTSDAVPVRPERICAELGDLMPSDGVVVVDTGHAGMWMAGFFDLSSANQAYVRSCGHLGWAFPAGLGAKCAAPDRATVVFTGDAGLYYHLAEIETAVRRGINLVTVINNNCGGNQSQRGFDRAYGGQATRQAREMWVYEDVDFKRVAESMGALGIRVDKPRHLRSAIEQAIEADRPVFVDVRTDIDVLAPPPVV